MAGENIREEHLKLLSVLQNLASNDPAGVAPMHKAAQRMSLDSVGKEADRKQFERLARELEDAGYVQVRGTDLAASHAQLSVTEKGRRLLKPDS